MSKRHIILFLAAALCCDLSFCGAEPAGHGAELLSNGSFERASPDATWPADWEHIAASPITWEAEGGTHFLRLVAPKQEQVIQQTRAVALSPDVKGVVLGVRFRVNGFKFGLNDKGGFVFSKDMHFNYQFLDASDKKMGGGGCVLDSHAKEWTEIERRVLVPEGTTKLNVSLLLNRISAGTLDVDEVRIHAMPAAEAQATIDAIAAAAKKAEEDAAEIPKLLALPSTTVPVKVSGNRLVNPSGADVWLQGVNVCSLEWSEKGENVLKSVKVAIDDWKANVVRLPVHDDFWFGRGKPPKGKPNDESAYRRIVDDAVKLAGARGAYVILDLHRFHAPDDAAAAFWKDAAARYKNNAAVLFDLYNEPTSIPWELWRNGGTVPVKPKKKGETPTSFHSPGMQGLVDAVRSTGAKNIVIAGGIDYAYDLSGVANGFALEDKGGNGIMYATHFYNWHRGWESKFLHLAQTYPLLVGEFGADVKKMSFIPAKNQEDPFTWTPDALGLVQHYHLNWTAFSLHPKATPVLIKDWDYTPTPFWGEFVKAALSGKRFEVKRLR